MDSRTCRLFVFTAALAAALTGCGKTAEKTPAPDASRDTAAALSTPPQSPIVGSESVVGLEALHDTVHARAARGDTLGLLRLFVRDSLYRAVVWPTQPSYEPGRDEVWNLVIGMNKANSSKGLRRMLGDVQYEKLALPPLPRYSMTRVSGGEIYGSTKADRKRGEVWLFAAALCLEGDCQVLTYAEAGLQGHRDSSRTQDPQNP